MHRLARLALISAAAGALVAGTVIPASAVAIRKVNRAEGDPSAAAPAPHAAEAPPADTFGPRYFDKRHSGAS